MGCASSGPLFVLVMRNQSKGPSFSGCLPIGCKLRAPRSGPLGRVGGLGRQGSRQPVGQTGFHDLAWLPGWGRLRLDAS